MLVVEILCPHGFGWVDHRGNRIDRLAFSKKYHERYEPGHYPLQSLGELYRNIDSIPESPLQSLTDWSVSISSIYSHKGKNFQTLDLIYHLEALNEAEGLEFSLIGCAARLMDDESVLFKGVVDSLNNTGETTRINISEHLQNPSIEKSAFPLIIGNSRAAQYLPVEIAKNAQGMDEILLGDSAVDSQLYIYLEKTGEYAAIEFLDERGNPNTSLVGGRIVFIDTQSERNLPSDLHYSQSLFLPKAMTDALRPDPSDPVPVNYVLGIDGNEEMVQVWNNTLSDGDGFVQIGRDWTDARLRKSHKALDPIRKASYGKKIRLHLEDTPASIAKTRTELGENGNGYIDFKDRYPIPLIYNYGGRINFPFDRAREGGGLVRGEPSMFLSLSREFAEGRFSEVKAGDYTYPHLYLNGAPYIAFNRFSFIFPDHGLPNAGQAMTTSMKLNVYFRNVDRYVKVNWFSIEGLNDNHYTAEAYNLPVDDDNPHSYEFDFAKDIVLFNSKKEPVSYAVTQIIHFNTLMGHHSAGAMRDQFHLYALKARRDVEIPYTDSIKLYVKARNAPGAASSASTIKPAVESLLKAAGRTDITVYDDTGCKIEFGMVMREASSFRDKLRSLAAASATLVRAKSESWINSLNLSSLAMEGKVAADIEIPLGAIMLRNNMADFQMQTPERMDLCTGIEITWGKNLATNSYERKTLVNGSGIYHDGASRELYSDERNRWDGILEQLGKNENLHGPNIKTVENEWIRGTGGAERMAMYFLYWLCKPLRKAELACITSRLPKGIDLGVLVWFELPGFHEKLGRTAWLVTEIKNDLDNRTTKLGLVEAWGVPSVPLNRYLLTEDGQKFLTEDSEGLKLER